MKSIQSNIKKAKKYLDNNHCVAVPTETVYGLAANAYSNSAVKKIFNLKKIYLLHKFHQTRNTIDEKHALIHFFQTLSMKS